MKYRVGEVVFQNYVNLHCVVIAWDKVLKAPNVWIDLVSLFVIMDVMVCFESILQGCLLVNVLPSIAPLLSSHISLTNYNTFNVAEMIFRYQ